MKGLKIQVKKTGSLIGCPLCYGSASNVHGIKWVPVRFDI